MTQDEELFTTHLLTMEEVWYVRDNQRHVNVVRVRALVESVEELENQLELVRAKLDAAVKVMNARRESTGWR